MRTAAIEQADSDVLVDEARDRLLRRWLLGLLVLGIVWRVTRYLLQFPIWGDESFICLNLVDQNYMGLTGQLRCCQVAPLLFLWGELTAFLCLGHSELALRLLPFLAGLGGLLLTWRLAHLILSPLARTLAVAFLAVAIWPVSMGTLVKPYAFDLLMSCILLVPAVEWLKRPEQTGWLLVLALLAPVAVFGSYPVLFVAGAVSLALLAPAWRHPGWTARGFFALYNVLLLTSFLANYLIIGLNQLDRTSGAVNAFMLDYWRDGFPPAGVLPFLDWFVRINTGRQFAYPIGGSDGQSSITTLLCLAGLWVLWRGKQRSLVVLCTTPFLLGLLAAFLRRYPYGGCCRLSQHLAPIICLLAGAGAAALIERVRSAELRRRWILGVCCLFAAIGTGGLVTDVLHPYRNDSDLWTRKLVREVTSYCGPNDQIVVLNDEWGVDVVFHWNLTCHLLEGGHVSWDGRVDKDRLKSRSSQVWVLNVGADSSWLGRVREALQQSQRTWLLANQIPYTVLSKRKDPPIRCDVYRYITPDGDGDGIKPLAIPCWP